MVGPDDVNDAGIEVEDINMQKVSTTPITTRLPVGDGQPSEKNEAVREFNEVTKALAQSVKKMKITAYVIFTFAALLTGVAAVMLPQLATDGYEAIRESDNSTNVTIYQLFRSTAYAAAATAVVFGLLNLGRASLDQATRFEKRLIAAHFLDFVFLSFNENLKRSDMTLKDVLGVLQGWGANVESAFSSGKFASPKSQNMEMKFTPSGMTLKSGTAAGSDKGKPDGS